MPRYIDADELIEAIKNELWDWNSLDGITSATVLKQTLTDIQNTPTADVVSKEDVINELINEISDRITQFLEANYEIIPKKTQVRCKDCKWHSKFLGEGFCSNFSITGFENDDYCSYGVRREDVKIH